MRRVIERDLGVRGVCSIVVLVPYDIPYLLSETLKISAEKPARLP